MNKRLKALEAKSAQEGLLLTEAQVIALEKARPRRRPTARSRANIRGIAAPKVLYLLAWLAAGGCAPCGSLSGSQIAAEVARNALSELQRIGAGRA